MDFKTFGKRELWAAGLFLVFALMYFLPVPVPHKIVLPLLVLSVFSVGRLPWQMCLAFVFSFLGDLSGSYKPQYHDTAFIGQMAGFALAHVFFVVFFLSWGLKRKREQQAAAKKATKKEKQQMLKGQGMYFAAVLALTMIIVVSAFNHVVPCVPAGVLQYGVSGYVCIIATMLFCALMTDDWQWGLGAALFVFSDFVLAWNMFVNPLPGEKYLIMVSYYAAQLVLYLRTSYCTKTNR